MQVLVQEGVRRFTVQNIAQAAGLTDGVLYGHLRLGSAERFYIADCLQRLQTCFEPTSERQRWFFISSGETGKADTDEYYVN
ncbi:MAG: hypothetical protein CSA75_03325 [Sorangium cellulosum]|nr:MAG: hypothetical protein CSA75_03325 [Sorangium cellulosum]